MTYFSNDENCAILVFAKSNAFENNSKKILKSDNNNFKLWNSLNQKVLKISQQSKIPFFVADESIQVGNTFGEKICNSIQTIFDKGFEKVIVIGNDCPELKVKHLKLAHSELKKNDFVFGPDYSGGDYLLGISKKHFNSDDFQNFDWQSNQLHQNLISFYFGYNTFLLPYLNDVNNTFSFKKAVYQLHFTSKLKIYLLSLIQQLSSLFFSVVSKIAKQEPSFLNYRGPPPFVLN